VRNTNRLTITHDKELELDPERGKAAALRAGLEIHAWDADGESGRRSGVHAEEKGEGKGAGDRGGAIGLEYAVLPRKSGH